MITTRSSHARSIAVFTVERDNSGNIAANEAENDITYTFNWDNKLRKAELSATTVELKYDPFGNRVYKESGQTERKYVVDITGGLPVILMELNGSGGIVKTYVYANSEVIAQHDGDREDEIYFYLHDRLGSVRLLIDDAGSVENHYTYDPFGELFAAETIENVSNPFKFTGQWFDNEIEEYYLRARQYNPHLSRFTSRDPIRGDFEEPLTLHKYLYCGSDPLNSTDPSGRTAWNLVAPVLTGYMLRDQAIDLAAYGAASLDFRFFDLAQFTDQFIPYALSMCTVSSFTPLWFQLIGFIGSVKSDDTGMGAKGLLTEGWAAMLYSKGFTTLSDELGVRNSDISAYVEWKGGYFSEYNWWKHPKF